MAHHQHQHHQSTQQQTASKAPPALDWLSFPAPTVVDAPHPDLFDFELDNSLSAYDQTQLQGLTLDYNTNAEAFQFYRSETPQGPPSVITASSESAYETLSQHSESLYNYSNPSPSQYGVDPSFTAADLGIDFSSFNVQSTTDMAVLSSLLDAHETLSSYSAGGRYDLSATRSTYSASAGSYGPAGTGAIAPQHTSMPRAPSADSPKSPDSSLIGEGGDSRKKYACPDCSRSFARAYNLKTHRATHDPHRLKPYVCPHRNCGRSFSRKHDLGRHLVSIHRDDTGSQYSVGGHSTASERSHHVGLSAEKAVRTWCDNCGRSLVGAQRTCNCNDVK